MLYCKKQTGGEPLIDIQKDIRELSMMGLMEKLLADKTTGRHILWATDAYETEGEAYGRGREIELAEISLVKTRARKAAEQQSSRTRRHGEVFTPRWVCDLMNDALDRDWFSVEKMEPDAWEDLDALFWQKKRHKTPRWQRYVDSRRLEITCGEAPYLAERYDVSTGEEIEVSSRRGLLDRKLLAISHFTETREDWQHWALRAVDATYGYEFQGDNLLIARVNIMKTVMEHYFSKWEEAAPASFLRKMTNKVAWNLWQMDGLSGRIPYCAEDPEGADLFSFGDIDIRPLLSVGQPVCRVYSWRSDCQSVSYEDVKARSCGMRFDYIVGNPPYQGEQNNNGRQPPIYHFFMDEAYKIANNVELISPARFLFDAGQTPKKWNRKMLNDEHFKVLYYESNGRKVFPNTEIKGGVAVTFRSSDKIFGAIKVFTQYEVLNKIVHKVFANQTLMLDSIIGSRGLYRFADTLFSDYPYAASRVGSGTGNMIVSNVFEKIPEIFTEKIPEPCNSSYYCKLLGRLGNGRVYRFILSRYVIDNPYLSSYNVLIPKSNGTGTFGEPLSMPVIAAPSEGATDTFISIGRFESYKDAAALIKYIKTKFFRTLLSAKKVTQDNPKSAWSLIPLQDFTAVSDIDWTKPIPEIDRQLYAKYGLDENEISFIEKNVKEMK